MIQNAGTFTIHLEDHTAGNMIKMQAPFSLSSRELLNNPNVLFAGYRMPHPLENKIEVKVQTNGKIKPAVAVGTGLDNLIKELEVLSARFEVGHTLNLQGALVTFRSAPAM